MRFPVLFLLAGTLLFPALLSAQESVSGTIRNGEGEPLPGATVSIKGTAKGRVTNTKGWFRFQDVAPGDYTLAVRYLGYQDVDKQITVIRGKSLVLEFTLLEDISMSDEVTVYGKLTKGQAKALNDQKNANNIRNVVSSEIFSRYPDVSAAETVQRLPGIAITRDQGEGEFVQVRGMSEQYNALTVNGQRMPSMEPDAGRAVGLDMIQTSLIETITVTKALTPDMDADALGGMVNFDLKEAAEKPEYSLYAAYGLNAQESEVETFGNDITSFFGSASRRFLDGKLGLLVAGSYHNTDRGSILESWRYEDKEQSILSQRRTLDYDVNRLRYGGVAHVDFQLDEANAWSLVFNHNGYEDDEIRRQARYDIDDDSEQRRTRNRVEDQTMNVLQLSGDNRISKLRLEYAGSWAKANEDLPDRTEFRFQADNELLSTLSPEQQQNLGATSSFDLPALPLNRVSFSQRYTEEETISGSLDLTIPITSSENSLVKVGGKLRTLKRDFKEDDITARPSDETPETTIARGDFGFPDIRFEDPEVDALNLDADASEIDLENSTASYTAEEQVIAGYAMNTTNWTDKLTSVAGVRVEQTSQEYSQTATGRDGEGDYVTVLPSAHLTYKLTPRTQLRAAYSSGLSRPNYTSLVPYESVNDEDMEISRGNPDLEATTAQNYDLMFEHYTDYLGFYSAGAFFKQMNDPIVQQGVTEMVDGEEFLVFSPINGGSATVFGLEFSVSQSLKSLNSDLLRWFTVNANYTYAHSTADFGDERDSLPLVNSPEHTANLSLTYDNNAVGFTAVVAGVYRHQVFNKFEDGDNIWLDRTVHLDASFSYRVLDQLSVILQLNNLTNESNTEINGDPAEDSSRIHEQETYGIWGTLGLRLSL